MSARVTIDIDELLLLKADARGFSLSPRQPVSSLLAGRHASRLRGRGLAFEELRHYHQGDDIRTMDWKATARLRSPYVRVYSEERERPVLLVVDQRRPMFFGSQRAMKSVAAAKAAALGAWRAIDSGDRVGGLIFNEHEIVEVRPHRSQTRVLRLLHEICRLNRQLVSNDEPSGDVTLNHAIEGALRVAKHDHLVVLITDLDGADDETQRLATQISAHNDVLIVAVYDPLGISLMGTPGMLANDGRRLWEIPTSAAFTKDFQAAFENGGCRKPLHLFAVSCRNTRSSRGRFDHFPQDRNRWLERHATGIGWLRDRAVVDNSVRTTRPRLNSVLRWMAGNVSPEADAGDLASR